MEKEIKIKNTGNFVRDIRRIIRKYSDCKYERRDLYFILHRNNKNDVFEGLSRHNYEIDDENQVLTIHEYKEMFESYKHKYIDLWTLLDTIYWEINFNLIDNMDVTEIKHYDIINL